LRSRKFFRFSSSVSGFFEPPFLPSPAAASSSAIIAASSSSSSSSSSNEGDGSFARPIGRLCVLWRVRFAGAGLALAGAAS
jgi:hypothetical protein